MQWFHDEKKQFSLYSLASIIYLRHENLSQLKIYLSFVTNFQSIRGKCLRLSVHLILCTHEFLFLMIIMFLVECTKAVFTQLFVIQSYKGLLMH